MRETVTTIEVKMEEVTTSFNYLVGAQSEGAEDIEWMKAKITDLEDRSRWNDLKIRGMPVSVQPSALKEYFIQFMSTLLPDTAPGELTIDRIHRLPKPPHLPDTVPRDTIVRIHSFHVKENLMRTTRNHSEYPQPYTNLAFYADLSKHTMLQRKNLTTITKPLRNDHIQYKWGHPFKLIITKDNKSHFVRTMAYLGTARTKTAHSHFWHAQHQ